MRKLLFALATLFVLTTAAFADPITLTLGAQTGGYTVRDLTPCAMTLNCQNATPRGSDFLIRDGNGTLLSTITFTLGNTSTLTLDTGQSATIMLGSFSYTGALPPAGVEYNFRVIALGASSTNGFTSSLSFAANGIFVQTVPQSPQGLNSLLTLTNGAQFLITGVTTSNGTVSATITRIGAQAEVPEPATMLLLGSGLAGIAAWRRRRKM